MHGDRYFIFKGSRTGHGYPFDILFWRTDRYAQTPSDLVLFIRVRHTHKSSPVLLLLLSPRTWQAIVFCTRRCEDVEEQRRVGMGAGKGGDFLFSPPVELKIRGGGDFMLQLSIVISLVGAAVTFTYCYGTRRFILCCNTRLHAVRMLRNEASHIWTLFYIIHHTGHLDDNLQGDHTGHHPDLSQDFFPPLSNPNKQKYQTQSLPRKEQEAGKSFTNSCAHVLHIQWLGNILYLLA